MRIILLILCALAFSNISYSSDLPEIVSDVYRGNLEKVKAYIAQGGDLNYKQPGHHGSLEGDSLLLTAIDNSRLDVTLELVSAGATVRFKEVVHAIGRGEKQISIYLLPYAEKMTQSEKDLLLLQASSSAYVGYAEIVRGLIGKGAVETAIIRGEVHPSNPIFAAFNSMNNPYAKEANEIYEYLIERASKRNSVNINVIVQKYVTEFKINIEECEAC